MTPEKKPAGYVYILTNPSFKDEWVKIGKSSRPVNIRSKELDNTAVPLPFEIYATARTEKYELLEKNLHRTIDRLSNLRIRQNREFFNIAPADALDLLRTLSSLIDDVQIEVYRDGKPCKESMPAPKSGQNTPSGKGGKKHPRPRFKFSMVGIPIGATLIFTPTGIEVKVASDDMIEYQDRLYKLSPFVGTFMPLERQTHSGTYQGAKYFTYKGEVLDRIRSRKERPNAGHSPSDKHSSPCGNSPTEELCSEE